MVECCVGARCTCFGFQKLCTPRAYTLLKNLFIPSVDCPFYNRSCLRLGIFQRCGLLLISLVLKESPIGE